MRRSLAALVITMAAGALQGCSVLAATAGSYNLTPQGLEVREQALRDRLALAAVDSSQTQVPPQQAPRDSLLRLLYAGTFAYYAGAWDTAAARLVAAEELADDRFTKSATQTAAAMLTNDRALSYTPGHTERLFIHYYGALAFAAKGDFESAAVQARRLGALLQRLEAETTDRDRALRATLRYASGAIFEAAGEDNDADVSYRNAQRLAGLDSAALPGRSAIPADSGDVIVLVEHGWVAHRVPQSLLIPVYGEEAKAFGPKGNAGQQLTVAATLAGRTLLVAATRPDQGVWWVDGQPVVINSWGNSGTAQRLDKGATLLTLSWPVLRKSSDPLRLGAAAGGTVAPSRLVGNVNEAAAADLTRDRQAILTRVIARSAVKLFAAEQAEAQAKKKWGGTTGSIVGGLFDAFNAATERADNRGWLLLPAGVSAVRLRLPAGKQPLAAELEGTSRALGDVDVRPGRLTVVSRRVWSRQVTPVAERTASAAQDLQ